MKKIKQLSISDYKPLSSSMINRHYYFDIKIIYENESDNNTIYKRYSEIEELYKILLLKYPGCRIPKFPEKSFMMNIHINEEEKKNIISKIEQFLSHLIEHKILSEKKVVNDFFANEKLNENKDLKTDLIKTNEDEDINNSDSIVNEDSNISEKEKEKKDKEAELFIKEFEQIDFKKSEYYETWLENNLINMFLEEENNEKKGIIDKTKGVFSYIYNRIFAGSSQDLSLNSNNLSENTISDSYYQEENVKYLEKISKDLGEEDYLKEYGKHIMKLNEGLSYIYNNFINIQKFNQTKLKSLSNIKKLCNDNLDCISKKDENKDDNNIIIENKINKYEKKDKKLFDNEINNKLKNYISINNEFYEIEVKKNLEKINENKIIVEELKEIYDRKKSHINFLMKLISNYNELDKKRKIEPDNKTINKDYEHVKKYLELETVFIKKLNLDLKYEIDFFKENKENNIYKYINELYINKNKKQNEVFDILNETISLDSDSETSKDENFENIEINNTKNNKEEKSKIKKDRSDSISSQDDDF